MPGTEPVVPAPPPSTSEDALARALVAVRDLRARAERAERAATEPIAVIGMGCRFPAGGNSPEEFWRLLDAGRHGLGTIPADRWDHRAYFDPAAPADSLISTDQGGFVDHPVDRFDAAFFNIAPVEANDVDPQQRLLLEVTWEALEHAGIAPDRLTGSATGVFVGLSTFDYSHLLMRSVDPADTGTYAGTGVAPSVAAGRLSFFLGVRGPSMTLDTACSSSLVSLAMAVQSLRSGGCRMALAGGVNLMLDPDAMISLSRLSVLSPTGRCHTFAAGADGYVRGEGAGMLVLKRLADAQADGDRVLAVIRAAAVNHDGRSSGLTVPSGPAQREVIERALAEARLEPADVDAVEAHGTGTPLGDPIEVRALDAVYGRGRPDDRPLRIGSVKTNIGHLEAAAGVAGVIKTVLALQHERLPAHLFCDELSPHVDWDAARVVVNREAHDWPRGERVRRAGVSGFGWGGTNAHVIVEEAPAVDGAPAEEPARPVLLVLSARDDAALTSLAETTADALDADALGPGAAGRGSPGRRAGLADAAWTTQTGRGRFRRRLAVTALDAADAVARLRAVDVSNPGPGVAVGSAAGRPRIGFVFTGQGAQLPGMGRDLYEHEPVFRQVLDECDAALTPHLPVPLLDVLHRDPARAELVHRTEYTQPAMFALQCGLAALWRSWGVVPEAVAGHSIGEYAAAVTAGAVDLADAAAMIAARGSLMGALPPGGRMEAVFADEETARSFLGAHRDRVSIAAVNGPTNVVLSGDGGALAQVLAAVDEAGIGHRPLEVSHAFHSPLMAPMVEAFDAAVRRATQRPPEIPFVSTVTGAVEHAAIATPAYWRDQVLATVRFADAAEAMRSTGVDHIVEIGPQPTLLGMLARLGFTGGLHASLRPGRGERTEREQVIDALGELWAAGLEPDWDAVGGGRRRRVPLPTYPFQRQRYWTPSSRASRAPAGAHPLLGTTTSVPVLGAVVHEATVAAGSPAWLGDHRLAGAVVFPAAAFAEMALAAAGPGAAPLDLAIQDALLLPEGEDVTLQTVVDDGPDGRRVRITSTAAGAAAGATRVHAVVRLGEAAAGHRLAPLDVAATLQTYETAADVATTYRRFAVAGLEYGPSFRGVTRLVRREGAALGRVELPLAAEARRYTIHPALLDSCFHVIDAALDPAGEDDMYVPVALSGVRVLRAGATGGWCHVEVSEREADGTVVARLALHDDAGEPVAVVERFEARRAPRSVWERALGLRSPSGHSYEIAWPVAPRPAHDEQPSSWVVVGQGPSAEQLTDTLREAGLEVDAVAGVELVDDAIDRVASTAPDRPVHVVAMVAQEVGDGLPTSRAGAAVSGVLALAQRLAARRAGSVQLAVVTRGARSVDGEPPDVAGSAVWGLARTIANEHPGLGCRCIDLDPVPGPVDAVELAAELRAGGAGGQAEDQVAFRGGRRCVARLERVVPGAEPVPPPYALKLPRRGSLDALGFGPAERRAPGTGEVEVEVRVTGLNFRDVLNVLGMYPGDPGPPGLECAGVVTAVGEGVDRLTVGDRVVGIAPTAFDSHVVTPADLMVRIPAAVSFAEAATLPIAYLTAAYGLGDLAALRPGETVLVHAAAGGVGMAAVAIAQRTGATVFATVGSEEKRRTLRALGVDHLYSSRTLDFADAVLADTGGRGVDVVLNSLSDDFIGESFRVLAPAGRFLEIGKRGVWSTERAHEARPDVAYHVYELADFLDVDPAGVQRSLQAVVDGVESGVLRALPVRAFPTDDVVEAFRFMAQARHIGKVVVVHRRGAPEIRSDGAYLVTGGLGGIGLALAEWLVAGGAGAITLVGRSAPSADASEVVDRLRVAGALVQVASGDVSVAGDVHRLVDVAGRDLPLRGVFHAAGVLDDGALDGQSWERVAAVLAPKADAAELLDTATRALDLDHFVLFSSVAALLGSPGQANYAAANAALDAVALRRRSAGSPALSIAWGAWAEAGMAARLDERERRRMADRGMQMLDTGLALDALDLLLGHHRAHAAVMAVDWGALARSRAEVPPFLSSVVGGAERTVDAGIVPLADQLPTAPADTHRQLAIDHVCAQVERVLGLAPGDTIDPHQHLSELGLDSLMAVELSNRLAVSTGLELASTVALEHDTATALADHLLTCLHHASAISDEVASLSDDEVLLSAGSVDGERAEPTGGGAAPGDGQLGALREDLLRRRLADAGVARLDPIPPRDPSTDPVLSYAQERMWFLDRLDGSNAALAVRMVFEVDGDLDVVAFRAALDEIQRRHDVLRTVYERRDGRPHPVVLPAGQLPLEELDLTGDPAQLDRLLATEAARTFDLERDPPIHVTLARLAPDRVVVSIVIHHIAADGTSLGVLLAELRTTYAALRNGRPAPLPPLPIQYDAYAAWQRSERSTRFAQDLDFWRAHLGDLPQFEIPPDHQRPARQSFDGGQVLAEVPAWLRERLEALAHAHGTTLFTVLLAAFDVVASRHAGSTDVVIGTPIAGRIRPELEPLIGPLLNTVVLRTDLSDAPTFAALVDRVRGVVLAATDHQQAPFELVLQMLNPPRDPSRSPLFQVMFNMLHFEARAVLGLEGVEARVVAQDDVGANFDMTMYVVDVAGSTTLRLVYDRHLFDPEHTEQLVEQYLSVLHQVVATPDVRIDRLSLLTGSAALPDLAAVLDTTWVGSVPSAVRATARREPAREAVVDGGRVITAGELWDRSTDVASRLQAASVGHGDVVAVLGHRSAPLTWAVVGALAAGAAYVVLDRHHPAQRLAELVRLARPSAWIALDAAGPVAPEIEAALDAAGVRARLHLAHAGADEVPLVPTIARDAVDRSVDAIGPDDPACLTFTSGSTGEPKGVLGRHGSLTHFLPWMSERFDVSSADRFSMLSGLAHDPLQRDLFWPMWLGAAVVVPDADTIGRPGALARWMREQGISVAHLTPAMGQVLAEALTVDADAAVPSLRAVLFIGEALTRGLVDRLHRMAPDAQVVNMYGTTETQRASGYHVVDPQPAAPEGTVPKEVLPLGTGMPGAQLLVRTPLGQPAGLGEVGEIVMRSPHLALGYHGDEALTAARFAPDPSGGQRYATGDLGRYRADGAVEYLGRADTQVQLRGFRIELGEIESALLRHPAVRDAAVVVRSTGGGDQLVAYPIFDPAVTPPTTAELKAHLRDRLPVYMVPSRFVAIDAFPLTANRKVDRRALPAPGGDEDLAGDRYVAPRTDVEAVVAAVVAETLDGDRIGVDEDFFELGGHSLHATSVLAKLYARFGVEIHLREFFVEPTVGHLAEVLLADPSTRARVERIAAIQRRLDQMSPDEVRAMLAARRATDEDAPHGG